MIPIGDIDINDSVMTVNSNGKFESLDEIRNIVIGQSAAGTITRLSDIADIQIQNPEDSAHYTYNKEDANLIALYFDSGINVVNFGDSIRQCIGQYCNYIPSNIQVHEVYFQPDVVSDAVNSFIWNLLESIILVLIVVMLGMNFRNGLVVSVAIPLSILINFVVMKLMGTEIQFVSLAALIIVLGMLVDNAIVISDAIQTNLDIGMERKSAVIEGTKKMIMPVFISMLTTVSAFASLLALSGAYRQLAFTLPVVIITCLVASFFVSIAVDEACLEAGRKRFRPILMSTMTTVLGLIPLGFGGNELFVPMARLMIIGLLVAMIINLILVPIIYDMFEKQT
ncbi:Multidrug resistance protein MdtB [anaerobic digester metagenome]